MRVACRSIGDVGAASSVVVAAHLSHADQSRRRNLHPLAGDVAVDT